MICISIAQESRRLALADMLNASRQCDLLDFRLDRFGKAPDVGEILAHKPKPIIFSCRRQQDGGNWDGTEEERLAILRQCIVSKADYVEIELDVADQIRKFPPAKRVISYTNFQDTPANIAEIYAEAQTKSPDVIKLVTLARTAEEAWPLLQILAKPALPTVVVGLGKPGVMLNVLGKKIGAPWAYAALERGMEAYPGQPTVQALREVYHYDQIERSTRLIGVTGFGERQYATVAALNATFAHQALPTRCLPLAIGSIPLFRKIIDAVKLTAVIVDADHQGPIISITSGLDVSAEGAGTVDLLLSREKSWIGFNSLRSAVLAALEASLRAKSPGDRPLAGRMVMIVGADAGARSIATSIKQLGGMLIIGSHQGEAAKQLAQELECRYVRFEAIYSTMHDILIVCNDDKDKGSLHAGYLRPGMTVLDLTAHLSKSPLLKEAEQRGCTAISPRLILREQLARQVQWITGKEAPAEVLAESLYSTFEEETS